MTKEKEQKDKRCSTKRHTENTKPTENLRYTSDTRRVIVKGHVQHLIWKSCWTSVYVTKYK